MRESPADPLPTELAEGIRGAFTFLDLTLPDLPSNLALDEALLVAAEEHGAAPSLRIWESPRVAVVLGASCRVREDVHVERCRSDGIPILRRSSGGGTVVIGPGALNFGVVLPIAAAPGLEAVDRAQVFVLERVARGFREIGRPVIVQGSGDLTLGGRKFAGSAQRRLRRHFLVHVSLRFDAPLEPVVRYTRQPARQPAYRAGRSHEAFLTNLPLPRASIVETLRKVWLPRPDVPTPAEVPSAIVDALVREKLGDPAWVERL